MNKQVKPQKVVEKRETTRHDTVVCVVIGKVGVLGKGSRKFALIAVEVLSRLQRGDLEKAGL